MLTLVEASKLEKGDVVRAGVIKMFAEASPLLAAIKWIDVPGGSYHYMQEGQLPGVAFRGVNESWTESTGVVVPQVEVLRIAGGELDVDTAIIEMHGEGVRTFHESQKVKALSLYLTKKLIKGDSTTDGREFDGLQNRITGSQLISAGNTNGGDPLSLLKLDEAIDAVDGATHLIMSKAMRRILTAAARDASVGGYITYSVDAFGNKVTQYNDIPILIVEDDDLGQRILDFNEVGAGGSTATCTSIYVVNLNEGYVNGLQNGGMKVKDLGEIDSKPAYRTRVGWNVSLATMHGRCAARYYGIKNVPATA
jgi:hypothetical protein